MRIGYLINTYPRPSHSFIRREIAALERNGVFVHRFAMRGQAEALTDPADLAEHAATERILEAGAPQLLGSALKQAAANPKAFISALRQARTRASAGESSLLRQLIYLAEGARVATRARALRLDHIHAHFGTNSTRVAAYAQLFGGRVSALPSTVRRNLTIPPVLIWGEKSRPRVFAWRSAVLDGRNYIAGLILPIGQKLKLSIAELICPIGLQ